MAVTATLTETLARKWWVLLLRGVLATLFALFAFLQPGMTLASLVLLFGAFALADGVLAAWSAIATRREDWGLLLLWGLVGIAAGLLTLVAPVVGAFALLIYVATWAIATGALEIAAALRLRKEIEGEWLLVAGGLTSIIFGVVLLLRPGVGAVAIAWLIGAYAMVYGAILIALSFEMRSFARPEALPS